MDILFSLMICSSQTVRLVNHCFTTRKSRTSRGLVCSTDVQFTNCTTRNPLFHDPYESYKSWTCRYTSSLYNDIQFTNCTTRKPLFPTSTTRTNQTGRAKRNMPLFGSYQFVYIGQPSNTSKHKVHKYLFFLQMHKISNFISCETSITCVTCEPRQLPVLALK